MKKLINLILLSAFFLLFVGCAVISLNDEVIGGTIGGFRISVETVEEGTRYSVISASFSITDPNGNTQSTNWTVIPGTNHKFDFQSTIPGMHYMCLTDYDSLGDTNVFITNVMFVSGKNYKISLVLGAETKYFGIYSETLPMGITLGLDAALDWWSGGENLTEDTVTYCEGTKSYRIAPTGAGWWGVGIRPNPTTAYKNLTTYTEGSLRFYFKGTKPVKVGIKFGASTERWMTPPAIFNYGMKTNNTWCLVSIPFSVLAPGLSFANISQYFMISADTNATYRYVPGASVYYIDNIHWCNKTN